MSPTDCGGSITTGSHNIATDSSCGAGFTVHADGQVNLGPLSAANGGLTPTMALQLPSVAADTGSPGTCAGLGNIDQRGFVRPADGDGVPGAVCDIGAFEFIPAQPGPNYTVDTTSPDGDGACHLPPEDCSLRDALTAANADGVPSAVVLANGEIYTLTAVDNNFNGLPLITSDITVEGNGSIIARDAGSPQFRFFQVTGTGVLRLQEATLMGGYAPDSASLGGGALRVEAGGAAHVSHSTLSGNRSGHGSGSVGDGKPGGAIYTLGATLTVTDSTVSGNITGSGGDSSGFGSAGTGGHGGAIYAGGTSSVAIERSTISGNAPGDGGNNSGFGTDGSGGSGAGIYIEANTTASITNSTIANNIAGDRGGSSGNGGSGGGIRNLSPNLTLTNVTLAGNRVGSGGSAAGGNISTTAAITARNTIVSAPALGANCAGTTFNVASANNLASDASCSPGFTQQSTAQINLAPLADNGGPTQTMAIIYPSVAINAGAWPYCFVPPVNNVDQREEQRDSRICDIGSFEAVDVDSDSDGVQDISDNCPDWPNASQAKPVWALPANDTDCDGFTNARESYLGTEPTLHCAVSTTPNDEKTLFGFPGEPPLPDRWPLDMNDTRQINTVDVGSYVGKLGLDNTEVGWTARLDLSQSPNGIINTVDVGFWVGRLGNVCSPSGP
jgi:hypothetical protein